LISLGALVGGNAAQQHTHVVGGSREELRKHSTTEIANWKDAARKADIKPDIRD